MNKLNFMVWPSINLNICFRDFQKNQFIAGTKFEQTAM